METSFIPYERERFFRNAGYLVLRRVFSAAQVDTAHTLLKADFEAGVEPVRVDNEGRVSRLAQLYGRHTEIDAMLTEGPMIEIMTGLLGPNVEMVLNRHNHSTMNLAGANNTGIHRDILQPTRGITTAIVYLEKSTVENGCTLVVPTSHMLPFIGKPNNGGTWMAGNPIYKDLLEQALPVPAEPGDVLIIDSTVFHAVSENTTDGSRMSFTMGYRSVDELQKGEPHACVLVAGERIYKGNEIADKHYQPKPKTRGGAPKAQRT